MRTMNWNHIALGFVTLGITASSCVIDHTDECLEDQTCTGPGGNIAQGGATGGLGGEGGVGAGGADGGGGTGGAPECMTDVDCTDAEEAQCDNGSCVPCVISDHCEGVAGLPVCDGGTCIECMLGEEDACTGGETCDLLAKECVGVGPLSVGNCEPCSNDTQCEMGHRCIPMDFEMMPHGHYCLKQFTMVGDCVEPFAVTINKPSISSATAVDYCGIEEDLATCEAVHALLQNWVCTGTDGMCGPNAMPEVSVPGAICEQVGTLANKCTYACGIASQCPNDAPANTCGTGQAMGMWCGG